MNNLWTKPITTYGETITPKQQAAAWRDWIALPDYLDRAGLVMHLIHHGVSEQVPTKSWELPELPADRTADKMLQRARKAGVIRYRHDRWVLVEPADPSAPADANVGNAP